MGNMESLTLEQKQKRVAYALNMCTVSVSQIIDYNDINILEQEYNAILNNLNLEQIPKDEALLKILKNLLDVITYFKISEVEKEFIEKEYQQKMKNAIWSAVPNFAMVLAGGSPLSMAISLANQVGIGYMNYRRNKAEYGQEREKQMWQLKRAAIEQFNYIRKELFDSSWRLADTYNFPDEYRLTEKQINEYDKILEDQDVTRRYERLESIKEYFEAYPPFWYFIGNAANLIANDQTLSLSNSSRDYYRDKALSYFEKFESIEQNSLLREDVLSASCALEHVDLLTLAPNYDRDKVCGLISRAAKMSGNDYDVLQLCAISYMKINQMEDAIGVLKRLVNAGYNTTINAQMLSAVYVRDSSKYRADYELLATRVNPQYLFPMPTSSSTDIKLLESEFESRQHDIVKKELQISLDNYKQKYTVKWNQILSTFDPNAEYPDDYFYNDDRARGKRRNDAERVFGSLDDKQKYQERLRSTSYELSIQELLNEMFDQLFLLGLFKDRGIQTKAEELVKAEIAYKKDSIRDIQRAISNKTFQMSDYILAETISLDSIVSRALLQLSNYGYSEIDRASGSKITEIESEIIGFCTRNGIKTPETTIGDKNSGNGSVERQRFGADLFGHEAVVDKKNAEYVKEMSNFVRAKIDSIEIYEAHKVELLPRDNPKFRGYFMDSSFKEGAKLEPNSILVVHDITKKDHDLVFTTDGLVDVKRGKYSFLTPYKEAKLWNNSIRMFKSEYKTDYLDILALYNLINELSRRFVRNVEDKVDHISGVLNANTLLKWFEERPDAMKSDVERIIAIPTKATLKQFGYAVDEELDTNKNLLQCYYDKSDNHVIGMRIVRFEEISSSLQSVIMDNDGILKINL